MGQVWAGGWISFGAAETAQASPEFACCPACAHVLLICPACGAIVPDPRELARVSATFFGSARCPACGEARVLTFLNASRAQIDALGFAADAYAWQRRAIG